MSNTLAIAAVTSTLRHVLHEALGGTEPAPVGGADVTTYRPAQLTDAGTIGNDASGLNVYLFDITPNHAWNLADLPTRGADGALVRRPLAALDLHYLVTAYGDEAALEPQRLLARATLALATTPVLTGAVIEAAVQKYGALETAFLQLADLADQSEPVKVSPTPLSLEELSKLWGVFGTPYLLSQAYTATVVLLEAQAPTRRALPVREPRVDVAPLTPITLERVEAEDGGAIATGVRIVLTGSGLLAAGTFAAIGGHRLAPETDSTPTRIVATLTADVPAGRHRTVVERIVAGDPVSGRPERTLARSNRIGIAVVPTILAVAPDPARVLIDVAPPLQAGQRATARFARVGGQPGDQASATVTLPPVPEAAAPLGRLVVARADLADGTWLVRVEVDGAESIPRLGASGTYDAPQVTLA